MPEIKLIKIVGGYKVTETYRYHSMRYNRHVTIFKGFVSDGATGARDIKSDAWIIHDHLCKYGRFDDGYPCSNWMASCVLSDILHRDGFTRRKYYWWIATFLFGGGQARKNGMIWVKP